ncbi:MAG: NrfD/PsrC family molybdoenzyme membrane anchor subunit [Burkholderiaceae bacterium]
MNAPAYLPERDAAGLTRDVTDPLLAQGFGRGWWAGFAISALLTVVMLAAMLWLFREGVGIWGIDTSNVWGFALANYVWWIGIGNAGTLISSMLLLTRQRWRASISRFAEAMTLFAAAIAGLFPILHLGRPWLFYWLIPYPDSMDLLPQWQSPLIWDFFAIASYLLFSMMFWYTGAIPDFATLRDRAKTRLAQLFYGMLALGWQGSARQWQAWHQYYLAMACLGVPLVVSVHSVVGMDFAAGLVPGWNETIFPPYFVIGAMYSGFGMVVVLAAVIRHALGLRHLITDAHFDVMARILLFSATVMLVSYATEWFFAWLSHDAAEREILRFQFGGAAAPLYWSMLACNCLAAQVFWLPAARRSVALIVAVALLVNVGMWLERILIVVVTPSRSFLPSQWQTYWPTLWDWLLLVGSLGFFALLFFVFLRFVPAVSIHETKARIREAV